jgi:hypothetical protein
VSTYICPVGHTTDSEKRGVTVISCPHLIGQRMQCSRLARSTSHLQGRQKPARGSDQRTLDDSKETQSL